MRRAHWVHGTLNMSRWLALQAYASRRRRLRSLLARREARAPGAQFWRLSAVVAAHGLSSGCAACGGGNCTGGVSCAKTSPPGDGAAMMLPDGGEVTLSRGYVGSTLAVVSPCAPLIEHQSGRCFASEELFLCTVFTACACARGRSDGASSSLEPIRKTLGCGRQKKVLIGGVAGWRILVDITAQ